MGKFIFMLMAIFVAANTMAHEGHDVSPGAIVAPHGGIVQTSGDINLELVTKGDGVQIYAFDHNMTPLKNVKLEGKIQFPKKNNAEAIKFNPDGDSLIAKVDSKSSHRYLLDLSVNFEGKKEKFKFNVEP